MKYAPIAAVMLMASFMGQAHAESPKTVVLELFTSQGCSSCPPADSLLRQLSHEDANLLPLSFHVDYWDHLGWKDPFSSKANTARQTIYARNVGGNQIYTPQLIVDGTQSLVGSREDAVRQAIAQSKSQASQVSVELKPVTGSNQLSLDIIPTNKISPNADIWVVHYNRLANTNVASGENGGRKLENINNVTSFEKLGALQHQPAHFTLAKPATQGEGLAIIVQQSNQGSVLGATAYQENAASL